MITTAILLITIPLYTLVMKAILLLILGFVVAIWIVELANAATDHSFNDWGIVPRTQLGLVGIATSPILHGGFGHVLSNTLPFLVLASVVAFRGPRRLVSVTFIVILLGGLGVWIFGRTAAHVGASGLVFGYFGYILASVWYDRRPLTIIIAVAVFFIYGGLLFGVVPRGGFVSWEGHLFGLLAGAVAARLHRRRVEGESESA